MNIGNSNFKNHDRTFGKFNQINFMNSSHLRILKVDKQIKNLKSNIEVFHSQNSDTHF